MAQLVANLVFDLSSSLDYVWELTMALLHCLSHALRNVKQNYMSLFRIYSTINTAKFDKVVLGCGLAFCQRRRQQVFRIYMLQFSLMAQD
jgi:hypothetical protein